MKNLDLFGSHRREEELRHAILLAQIQEYNRVAREYGKPEKKEPDFSGEKMSAIRAFFVRLDLFGVNKRHKQEVREEMQIAAKQEGAAVRCKFERERMESAEMLKKTGVADLLDTIKTAKVRFNDGCFWLNEKLFIARQGAYVYVSELPAGAVETSFLFKFPASQWEIVKCACADQLRKQQLSGMPGTDYQK